MKRLYVEQKLSAAKIADVYGMRSTNSKSAETLVLYHLRKFDIERRDRAEHIRKVTEEVVDEWVNRYQAGESLKQIAGVGFNPVTIFYHLKGRGVRLRDKVEAQIKAVSKYERRPFGGDELEMWYLIGFRYGDLQAVRHGRAVRVRVSTTHRAMADLFESLFSPYGHVSRYPRTAKLTGFEWSLESDLDESFDFLLRKPQISELETLSADKFTAFVAGVFDAEGSILLHKKRKWFNPEAWISNSDSRLIDFVAERLGDQGYHVSVSWNQQLLDRDGVEGQSKMGRLQVLRFQEAQKFLRMLPIRHLEKTVRRDLILKMEFRSSAQMRTELARDWKTSSNQIREQTRGFVEAARLALKTRKSKNDNHPS